MAGLVSCQSVSGEPLKIRVEFMDHSIALKTREVIRKSVVTLAKLFSLKNMEHQEVFYVPRERSACGAIYYDGVNVGKCAGISKNYAGDFCGSVEIPPAHLEGLKIYDYDNIQHLNESLPEGKGFSDGTNFLIYVTSRYSRDCHNSFGHSLVCRADTRLVGGVPSGRPLAGVINLCEVKKNQSEVFLRRIIVHEVIHLLGFNYRSIQEFIDCDPWEDAPSTHFSTSVLPKLADNGLKENLICWKQKDVLEARQNEIILQSDHIERAALQMESYLNVTLDHMDSLMVAECLNTLSSTDFKNGTFEKVTQVFNEFGGITLAKSQTGVHWPEELFPNTVSVMVPGNLESRSVFVDLLTLAVLETSGWYSLNHQILPCINCLLNTADELEQCVSNEYDFEPLLKEETPVIYEDKALQWGNFSDGEINNTKLNKSHVGTTSFDNVSEKEEQSFFIRENTSWDTNLPLHIENGESRNSEVTVILIAASQLINLVFFGSAR